MTLDWDTEPVPNGYLIMTWHKQRGRVSSAFVVCEDEPLKPLTLDIAEALISRVINGNEWLQRPRQGSGI